MNWMPVRVFLRGGYKNLKGPTVVSSHGYPIFTVMPAKNRTEPDTVRQPDPNEKPPEGLT